MKKTIAFVLIYMSIFFNIISVYGETFDTGVRACILVDFASGQILYEKNSNEKGLYPASTTKIMTAVVAIEKGNPDQLMIASSDAVNDIGKDGMNIGIMAGEEIRLDDLLNALLISSANETANIIAENICATRAEFVELMNKKARELGALDTNFVNPCGSHDPNHYTTAGDLARIARYAMTLPKFREIVQKPSYNMPPTNKHSSWPVLPSTNKLLTEKAYESKYYTQVTGIKTGYTGQAGYNLVSSARNNEGMELIAVVMDAKPPSRNEFIYSKELLEYGFMNYSIQKAVEEGQIIASIPVEDAINDNGLDVAASSSISCALPNNREKWNIEKKEHISTPVKAPVKYGNVMGYVEYYRDGVFLGKTDVYATRAVEKAYRSKTVKPADETAGDTSFRNVLTISLLILLLFFTVRIILRRISRMVRNRKRKNA